MDRYGPDGCGFFGFGCRALAGDVFKERRTLPKGFFNSLYGVPQEVSILEITPKYYNLDVLIHQPKEETSVAAHRSGAIAAVNGSYFNMKVGNSVCYLRKTEWWWIQLPTAHWVRFPMELYS